MPPARPGFRLELAGVPAVAVVAVELIVSVCHINLIVANQSAIMSHLYCILTHKHVLVQRCFSPAIMMAIIVCWDTPVQCMHNMHASAELYLQLAPSYYTWWKLCEICKALSWRFCWIIEAVL